MHRHGLEATHSLRFETEGDTSVVELERLVEQFSTDIDADGFRELDREREDEE